MTHKDVLLSYSYAQRTAREAYDQQIAEERAELELGNAYIPPEVGLMSPGSASASSASPLQSPTANEETTTTTTGETFKQS